MDNEATHHPLRSLKRQIEIDRKGGFPSRSTYHSALRIALPDEHQLSHDVFA